MATHWETIRVKGDQVVERIKELIHEGNVRRVIVKQGDQTVAEFPLTIGVVGVVGAPILAAVGALTALLTECSIEVQRRAGDGAVDGEPPPPDEPSAADDPGLTH
jgi:hypothetical protein